MARNFTVQAHSAGEPIWQVLICVLGDFRILKLGRPATIPLGGKAEVLLRVLALQPGYSLHRDRLLDCLWPDSGSRMAGQSLNSLVYALHRLLGDALRGAAPLVHVGRMYRLNTQAGITIDVNVFDAAANRGDHALKRCLYPDAVRHYRNAVGIYKGDLVAGTEVESVLERERLRARYLTILMRLADLHFRKGDYSAALEHALKLLKHEPCREDAHRMAMRCHVKLGERAQALRQYRLCAQALRSEFEAAPESATKALYDQVRLHPSDV